MGEGGKRSRTRKEEVVVCNGHLQSNPEYTEFLQNPIEEKYEMAASHRLNISLLHFLLNCASKETSANPDNRNKKLIYDDVKSGKTPFANGTCLGKF